MALALSLPQNVAVAMGVRMLKNPLVTMEQILTFTDNELIVEVPEVASAEASA
jgi:uncharacterized protein (DUF2062 family)